MKIKCEITDILYVHYSYALSCQTVNGGVYSGKLLSGAQQRSAAGFPPGAGSSGGPGGLALGSSAIQRRCGNSAARAAQPRPRLHPEPLLQLPRRGGKNTAANPMLPGKHTRHSQQNFSKLKGKNPQP